jgi:acetyl/propionyl-CoA carboxylase alpha subunit
MAIALRYQGLGTWEFLVNSKDATFFFLEINPRLQVEHTISECIAGVDLVREQLLIAQGLYNSDNSRLGDSENAQTPPSAMSVQLRLCAEDPSNNFALSIGKVTDVNFPTGNGIRVDTHLLKGGSVGSDFDNLVAKIIITASTVNEVVLKCRRALRDTRIAGLRTNLNLLRAIVGDAEFVSGNTTTSWLEYKQRDLVSMGDRIGKETEDALFALPQFSSTTATSVGLTTSSHTFRKGDAWSLVLKDLSQVTAADPPAHHLKIEKLSKNDFPESLAAEVSFTMPGSKSRSYRMIMNSTSQSAEAAASTHRRGDPKNKSHIVLPMGGKLVEILVDEGDEVKENQVIAFIKQMKMELEVRSPRAGKVTWVIELENEEGDDVAEGVLLAEVTSGNQGPEIRSRL